MNTAPISKIKIESKLALIRDSLFSLEQLAKIGETEWVADKKNFAVSEHYLRRALEAVFDIAGHIVSRYPMASGKRPTNYKGLVLVMAEKNCERRVWKNRLVQMADYRNRMVHFYDEITDQEMYYILKNKLSDIEIYANAIVYLLKNPGDFSLTIEE